MYILGKTIHERFLIETFWIKTITFCELLSEEDEVISD